MKIPQNSPHKFSVVIEDLMEKYQADIRKIKLSRVKTHEYLVMTLDYRTPGEVNINMTDYVKNMIK